MYQFSKSAQRRLQKGATATLYIILFMVFGFNDDPVISVTGVTLRLHASSLLIGGPLTLDAIVEPAEASKQTVIWSTEWDKLCVFTDNCCYLKRLLIFIRAVGLPLRQLVSSTAQGDELQSLCSNRYPVIKGLATTVWKLQRTAKQTKRLVKGVANQKETKQFLSKKRSLQPILILPLPEKGKKLMSDKCRSQLAW